MQDSTNAALATIAGHIRDLGLQLAVDKTEAVVRLGSPLGGTTDTSGRSDRSVRIIPEVIGYFPRMQGDDVWYTPLRAASEKSQGMMAALSVLIPNVSDPREGRRRLHVNVVQLLLLYGALTWAPSLVRDRRSVVVLARIQRWAVIRNMHAYCTVIMAK